MIRPLAGALTLLLTLAGTGAAVAQTQLLAPVFSDHAVLQRGRPIAVWGQARPGEAVRVQLGGDQAQATADAAGHWRATLPTRDAGGPYDLTVRDADGATQALHDILVGDVWLCSGQSNMELSVGHTLKFDGDLAGLADDQIRLLRPPKVAAPAPRSAFGAPTVWAPARAGALEGFSAVCFYMGRDLRADQHVAIGLIDAAWGGSAIRAWISPDALRGLGGYDQALQVLARHDADPAAAELGWRDTVRRWFLDHDPGSAAAPAWSAPALDDRAWTTTAADGFWKASGDPALTRFDGVVWYRTTIALTADQAAGAASLMLGPVDEVDTSFVNGVEIGQTESWGAPRTYGVAGRLHAGVNSIVVRVVNTDGGGGGLWGRPRERGLRLNNGSILPLAGPWRYRRGASLAETGEAPQTPWLDITGVSTLYNGMIAPLAGYDLRGIAWYQGETDAGQAAGYGQRLRGLMADWRGRFGADLPFLVAQLPDYGPPVSQPGASDWAALRDVQRRVVQQDPKAGLAVIIDIGQRTDPHPADKQDVGHRLALLARRLAYGEAVVASGPQPLVALRTGDRVMVSFAEVGSGLAVYGAARPVGFEACDSSDTCHFVDATAVKDQVALDVSGLGAVTKVRYAWADSPVVNLYNAEGLPATPFEIPVR